MILLLAILLGFAAAQSSQPWTHSWENIQQAFFTDFQAPTLMSQEQLAFLAENYAIVSLEKCTGVNQNLTTEIGIYETAQALKLLNPNLKILFYWSVQQAGISCYAANAELEANPQWLLKDDYGNIVNNGGQPVVDFTQPEVQEWWSNVPFTWSNATSFIDGILADGSGDAVFPNISSARLLQIDLAMNATTLALQNKFAQANGGQVIGNGIVEYGGFFDHDMNTLPYLGGAMAEHFAVFEAVNSDGSLDTAMVDNMIQDVVTAAALNKTVVVALWPGPCIEPINGLGPSWPNGQEPQTQAGRAQALLDNVNFTMAAYLIMAQPSVYFQYQWWYSSDNGMIPCPTDPSSCAFPTPFYPQFKLPLGPPTGPYQMNNYVYTRSFQYADVVLNLNNPTASTVTFHS